MHRTLRNPKLVSRLSYGGLVLDYVFPQNYRAFAVLRYCHTLTPKNFLVKYMAEWRVLFRPAGDDFRNKKAAIAAAAKIIAKLTDNFFFEKQIFILSPLYDDTLIIPHFEENGNKPAGIIPKNSISPLLFKTNPQIRVIIGSQTAV